MVNSRCSLPAGITIALIVTVVCLGFNVLHTARRIGLVHLSGYEPQYSYVGDDYPTYLPMGGNEEVLMTVEETVHYPLTGERARVEWLSTSPAGVGYVRLGTPNRYIIPSMFHQMHCLRLIQHALDFGMDDPTYSIYHVQHCLNFLRQMTLCTPDLTLEPVDLDLAASSEGITHVCRDWEAIYTEVERNYYVWSNHTHT